jgi:hypothetical protein
MALLLPIEEHLASNREAFLYGYGHFAVFASTAAIGAALEVAVDQAVGTADVPPGSRPLP